MARKRSQSARRKPRADAQRNRERILEVAKAKKIIAPALNTLVGGPSKVIEASYAQIHEAIRALVKRAIESGDIRKDLDPVDLLKALVGVSYVSASPDWRQSARRLVDILITGSRPIK